MGGVANTPATAMEEDDGGTFVRRHVSWRLEDVQQEFFVAELFVDDLLLRLGQGLFGAFLGLWPGNARPRQKQTKSNDSEGHVTHCSLLQGQADLHRTLYDASFSLTDHLQPPTPHSAFFHSTKSRFASNVRIFKPTRSP